MIISYYDNFQMKIVDNIFLHTSITRQFLLIYYRSIVSRQHKQLNIKSQKNTTQSQSTRPFRQFCFV